MENDAKLKASNQVTTGISGTTFTCGPQCIDGKEHEWNGPVVKLDYGGSSSCSKCGKLAIDVSMWY